MITRVDLSDAVTSANSTGDVRPPRHRAVARLSGSVLSDRDDPDGHRLLEQSEARVAGGLGPPTLRNPIVYELRKHLADDLLAVSSHRHGSCGATVDPRPDDRGIPDPPRHHERGPSCRSAGGVSARSVSRHASHGTGEFTEGLPLSRVRREVARPNLFQGILPPREGLGR